MSNKKMIVGLSVLAVVLLGVITIFSSFNNLSGSKNQVDKAWSQVEVTYQRRADLIPNLVAVAEQASVREQAILTAVVDARANAINATVVEGDASKLEQAQGEVTSALSSLIAISEDYPELKSNENWLDLQAQIEGTENRIYVARADYNESAEKFNHKIVTLPSALWAKSFGFTKVDYFKATSGSDVAPTITFDK